MHKRLHPYTHNNKTNAHYGLGAVYSTNVPPTLPYTPYTNFLPTFNNLREFGPLSSAKTAFLAKLRLSAARSNHYIKTAHAGAARAEVDTVAGSVSPGRRLIPAATGQNVGRVKC